MVFVTVDTSRQNMNPGLTPAQGRVVFHQERLLRSTGTHPGVAAEYRRACKIAGLPNAIAQMTVSDCRAALRYLEDACRVFGIDRFRDCDTQWSAL